ncbi:MAG TPA: PQQ-binding-like beta-propeller repeat protein [Ignavibacteriales bacterium]|nr:PQQ-binding-like beta-propeller repeat protein [Ignavibacteriales bacterium]
MRTFKLNPVFLLLIFFIFQNLNAQSETFRGSLEHKGYSSSVFSDSGKFKWRFKTDGMIRSTPAVSNKMVYFGSRDKFFYALDKSSGSLAWKFQTGDDISSSPAVSDGAVYFLSRDNFFYALEALTGRLLWKFQTGEELNQPKGNYKNGGWDYFLSSPAVDKGTVFFGSGDGYFYALGAKDGSIKWKFKTESIVRASPAIKNGIVYFGSHDGNLYALEESTGKTVWKFKTKGNKYFPKGEVQSSPVVTDSMIFFGSRDGMLYALDIKTGEKKWTFDHEGSWVITSPAAVNGLVYSGSSDAQFFNAVDMKTGKEKWRVKTQANVFSSPVVAGSMVYFGCWNGVVYGVNALTGEEKWGVYLEGPVQSSPVIDNGVMYIGCDDGYLYAFQ